MKKRIYSTPRVNLVKIDNDISLCLQSPPSGPGEAPSMPAPDFFGGGF